METPKAVVERLSGEYLRILRELDRVWLAEAKLEEQELALAKDRDRIARSLRVIEREFRLKPTKVPDPEDWREAFKERHREKLRADAKSGPTIASLIDTALKKNPNGLTAGQVRKAIISDLPGVGPVESIRAVLSRYAAKQGWEKDTGERPVRWRKKP